MKEIIQQENKILRKKADLIDPKEIGSDKIKKIIADMKESLKSQSDGVALAAPQIAVSLRIFVVSPIAYDSVEFSGERKYVFINPEIIKQSRDRKLMEEGCLSVRPWYGRVRRSSKTTVRAIDENGDQFEMEGTGLLSQIFQHEIDHLEGILFIDKAKDLIEIPPGSLKK